MRTARMHRMLQVGLVFSLLVSVVMGVIVIRDMRSFVNWGVLIVSLLNAFTFWEQLRTKKPAG